MGTLVNRKLAPALDFESMEDLPLSSREFEVLELVRAGRTNRSAAVQLGISERTVREHVARILLKLRVGSRLEAAVVATEWHMRRLGHRPAADREPSAKLYQ
jgi:DNA-binding NarL/FixJ family response regulator